MPDKKTYRIDENALREKLTNYTVSFNQDSLRFLEEEVAHVKTHNPIELPEARKIAQYIGIPMAIAVLGCAVYFGFNYVKNLPAANAKKDSIAVVKPTVVPKVEVKKETPPPPVNTASVALEVRKDTIVTQSIQPVKTKEKKNTAEQIKTNKKDTTQTSKVEKTKLDTIVKKNKQDTSTVSKTKESNPKKKKKKRKSSIDATDDIRQSQPNNADDDVVIPDNTQQ